MSKFSDKCKELLTENGYNVYRLSQTASLERTALQRMITGKRLPGIEFVEAFCNALRISHSDKKELIELYKMEQMENQPIGIMLRSFNFFIHCLTLKKKDLYTII